MKNWKIKLSLFLNYFVFAILLNSVGTVILQVQNNYGITQGAASVLEAFKDLSIAIVSFLVASYITRIGYKRSMLLALAFVSIACLLMPSIGGFAMTKLLFAVVGASFALIKVSVFATIGIVTSNKKDHASFMNFIESFFMIGILTGYFIFSAFVDNDNPASTSWLNVYYLLAGISIVAFLLLLSAPLDESSVKNTESKPILKDFAVMFKLAIRPLVLIFVINVFFYVLIEQSIMSWPPAFKVKVYSLTAGISTIAFLLLLSASLNKSSVKATEQKSLFKDFADMFKLAIRPLVLIFVISAFFYVLIEQSIMSWLPTFNNQVLHLSTTLSIQMASILAASTAIGRFIAGIVLRKIHWLPVLIVCLLIAAILVLLVIPLAGKVQVASIDSWADAPLAAFIFPVIGLLLAPVYPAINSAILSSLPPRQHGPMSGLIVIFSALGGTTGSIITGNIFQSYGGQTAFYFSLVPIGILIVSLIFFNHLQKKTTVEVLPGSHPMH